MNYRLRELDIIVNADNDARKIRVSTAAGSIQVYDTAIAAFCIMPSGSYRTFTIGDRVVSIGNANWQAMQDGSPLYIYARIKSSFTTDDGHEQEFVPSVADIIFSVHTPQEYTPEGTDETVGGERYAHIYYICIGSVTYDSVQQRCELSLDSGSLGTDQYREENSASDIFEQVELQGNRIVRQRKPVMALRQNVTSERAFSVIGDQEVYLDPSVNAFDVILLNLCNGSESQGYPTLILPKASDNVGQEYTFIGTYPSYGMTTETEYPVTISVINRQDVITYIHNNHARSIRSFNPAYPCFIKLLATYNGWVVGYGNEYMPGNYPDGGDVPEGDDSGGDDYGYNPDSYEYGYDGEYPFMGEL